MQYSKSVLVPWANVDSVVLRGTVEIPSQYKQFVITHLSSCSHPKCEQCGITKQTHSSLSQCEQCGTTKQGGGSLSQYEQCGITSLSSGCHSKCEKSGIIKYSGCSLKQCGITQHSLSWCEQCGITKQSDSSQSQGGYSGIRQHCDGSHRQCGKCGIPKQSGHSEPVWALRYYKTQWWFQASVNNVTLNSRLVISRESGNTAVLPRRVVDPWASVHKVVLQSTLVVPEPVWTVWYYKAETWFPEPLWTLLYYKAELWVTQPMWTMWY